MDHLIINADILELFPKRKADTHKGSFKQVLVIGGSAPMPGAPVLSSQAALRVGAGIVRRIEFSGAKDTVLAWPEVMRVCLNGDFLTSEHLPIISNLLSDQTCIVFGPGLGQNPETKNAFEILLKFLEKSKIPCVLDADALNILALLTNDKNIFDLSHCVLTPHPGEAARLLGISSEVIQANRYESSRALYKKYNCVIVLKGAGSICYADNFGYVCDLGNPFMATPGSGDVLSGVIAGLIAQNMSLKDAAILGTWIHAKAGDLAHEKNNAPIIASEITEMIPTVLSANF